MLIVLTGKTASGKDTIKDLILKKFTSFKRVITTTSRPIRKGEQQDIDYHFISSEDFKKKIGDGEFVEYVEYGGNLYGTTKQELSKAGKGDLLWKMDPSRAGEIREFINRAFSKDLSKKLLKDLILIYITTSDQVILQRLQQRGLSNEEIEKRMRDDKRIWEKFWMNYDNIIDNQLGEINKTVDSVSRLINKASAY